MGSWIIKLVEMPLFCEQKYFELYKKELKSNWCCPTFNYYTSEDAARILVAIVDGCRTDAPGSFIAWLCQHTVVHAMEIPTRRYDIGNFQSYEQVQGNI